MAAAIPAGKDRPPHPVDPAVAGPAPARLPSFHRTGTFRPGEDERPGDPRGVIPERRAVRL